MKNSVKVDYYFFSGFIYDQTKSYTLSYVMSGAFTVSGAAIMFLMHCMRKDVIGDTTPALPDPVEVGTSIALCFKKISVRFQKSKHFARTGIVLHKQSLHLIYQPKSYLSI